MEFVERYISQRESLRSLIQRVKPDKVGIEFPVFDQMYSEGISLSTPSFELRNDNNSAIL
jgi:hypothetical protein